ncbi:MAG: DUF3658 domain-containing protein [Bacteroidales bacterium]|nr:DUF3658 domain-containing protein [Bacteroidales bacterium]
MSFKKKDLHIVFYHADRTFIDSGAYNPDDIILFHFIDVLTMGPMCDLNCKEDVKKRKAWLEKTFGDEMYNELQLSAVDQDIATITATLEVADQIEDIYIWTGYDAAEMIATARVMNHLISLDKRIYVLDFSNVQVQNIVGQTVTPKSLVQTDSFQIKDVATHFKLQQSADLIQWRELWHKNILSESSLLRILDKDGNIYHKQVEYFDAILLSYVKKEFQKAARVIGETLVDIDFAVGDSYLNWRLKELVLRNVLEFRGKLIEIRDYEVRGDCGSSPQ